MSSEGHGGRTREDDYPEINISRIRIGGDVGGLIVVIGTTVCLLIGLPTARAFMGEALAGGVVVAAALAWWHQRRRRNDADEITGLDIGRR
jgi:hypothetical protein